MTDPTTPRGERPRAHPPETTEGWYALHQVFAWNRPALRAIPHATLSTQKTQAERMQAAFFPNSREYARTWGLDDARFDRLPPTTMVMHPGPMNRGLEIAARVADSPQSTVREQVANGVSVRMAALYVLLSGERGEG